MTFRHALLFSFLALIGGFLGGLVGRPVVAQAQVTQVRVNNDITIPNEGLRFIDQNMKVVAFMGIQAGNCFFTLLDSQGKPSISFSSGVGGSVNFSSLADGAQMEIASANGANRTRLSATSLGATFEAEASKRVFMINNTGASSQISMPGAVGKRGIDMIVGPSGSSLMMNNGLGVPSVSFEGTAGGGLFTGRDGTGKTTTTIGGTGVFSSYVDGKVVWRAPAGGN